MFTSLNSIYYDIYNSELLMSMYILHTYTHYYIRSLYIVVQYIMQLQKIASEQCTNESMHACMYMCIYVSAYLCMY